MRAFLRLRLSQAPGGIEVAAKAKSVAMKPFDAMADMVCEIARPMLSKIDMSDGSLPAIVVSCTGVEDLVTVGLIAYI